MDSSKGCPDIPAASLSKLEKLLSHILESICHYLSPGIALGPSLEAFYLTSKTYRDASDSKRFRLLHISCNTQESCALISGAAWTFWALVIVSITFASS